MWDLLHKYKYSDKEKEMHTMANQAKTRPAHISPSNAPKFVATSMGRVKQPVMGEKRCNLPKI
jgi:hypothetical protein